MRALVLVAFLLLAAHCTPVRRFRPGIIIPYCRFLNWKQCQRLHEFLNNCRKPPMNRRTTAAPSAPTAETEPVLTGTPPAPLTPSGRGDV